MEFATDPSSHILVFLVLGIEPGLKEVGITRGSAHILWRSGAFTGDAAGIFHTLLARNADQAKEVAPTVSEVILVEEGQRVLVAAMGKMKISHPHFGGLEGRVVGQTILIELRRAINQAADIELMQMTISPSERSLQHFVQLSEVEADRQLENTADLGFDVEDTNLGAHDEIVWIKKVQHTANHAA